MPFASPLRNKEAPPEILEIASVRTWLSRERGGPATLTLTQMPEPRVGAGEVLISVRACGVNFFDFLIIQDLYQLKPPRPFAPGAEWTGVVAQIGAGVKHINVGDRVLAAASYGGLAERVVVPEHACRRLPDAMSFSDGAGYQTAFGTGYYSLRHRGALQPGESLLVLGAAGGVGAAAVQLGKALGAKVLAVASTEEKAAFACSQGADDSAVLPHDGDMAGAVTRLKNMCGPAGANVVYDPVGGSLAEAALRAIAWDGRYLIVGFTAGIPSFPLNLPLLKHASVLGCRWGAFARANPESARRYNAELDALYVAGKIKPCVTRVYPFEDAPDAIACLGAGQAVGKVVVQVSSH